MSSPAPPARRHWLGVALAATLLFGVLTPWVLRPWFLAEDEFPMARGMAAGMVNVDLHLNVWILAWTAHAALHAPSELFDGNVFYPGRHAIVGSENMLSHLPVTVPVLAATGSALDVLKAMAFESFVLSGVAMALLVHFHTGDLAAALVAGAAFTLVPWRPSALPQPQYLGMQYQPFALLAVDAWLSRGRRRALVGLALALALQALSGVYLGFFTYVTVPVYALVRLLQAGADRRAWIGMAVAGIGSAFLTLPAAWPYLQASSSGVLPSHDPTLLEFFSATPMTYLSRGFLDTAGLVAPALALLGLPLLLLRRAPAADGAPATKAPVLAAWAFTLAAMVVSFGPTLHVLGWSLPLPYRLLYAWVPGFQTARAPMRGVVIVAGGLALLAGYAFAMLTARWKTPLRWAAAFWSIVVATVWAAPFPIATMPAKLGAHAAPVYRWLAEQPHQGGVLELPAWQTTADIASNARNTRYMVSSTTHWQSILNGWTAYVPPTTEFVADLVRRLPDPDAFANLVDAVDLRLVVLHRAALTPAESARWDTPPPGLEPVARFDDADQVFAVRRQPTRPWRAQILPRAAAPAADSLSGIPTTPLAASCRVARLTLQAPTEMGSGFGLMPIGATVVNDGDCTWPALGVRPEGLVLLRARWIAPSGKEFPVSATSRLARDLAPRARTEEALFVPPASGETGTWTLAVTLEQDGVAGPIARATAAVGPRPH